MRRAHALAVILHGDARLARVGVEGEADPNGSLLAILKGVLECVCYKLVDDQSCWNGSVERHGDGSRFDRNSHRFVLWVDVCAQRSEVFAEVDMAHAFLEGELV